MYAKHFQVLIYFKNTYKFDQIKHIIVGTLLEIKYIYYLPRCLTINVNTFTKYLYLILGTKFIPDTRTNFLFMSLWRTIIFNIWFLLSTMNLIVCRLLNAYSTYIRECLKNIEFICKVMHCVCLSIAILPLPISNNCLTKFLTETSCCSCTRILVVKIKRTGLRNAKSISF